MARTADGFCWGWAVAWAMFMASAGAQTVPPPRSSLAMPAGSLSSAAAAALQEMASHAGVVFSGQVERVERNDAAGFVDVHFRILQAVRGCPASGVYVLREWAGLWIAHPERYRGGQRRLMLLTARGPSGMSSPVGGMDGAIPILAAVAQPIADAAGVAPVDTGNLAEDAVDMRWIQARVQRVGVMSAVTARARAVAGAEEWAGPTTAIGGGASSLSAVLSLLRGGDGVGDAQR